MKQHTIKSGEGSRKAKKRVGRGGKTGTYSGRGMKGQKARTGGGVRVGFEGGQTPLVRRMPKLKGFLNPNREEYFPLNFSLLERVFNDGDEVNIKTLIAKKVLKKASKIKLLGNGELSKKLTIEVDAASTTAVTKMEKAGGTLVLIKKHA